jgi:D-serine deaminase-like pyridoxal phosphate-dependent protein
MSTVCDDVLVAYPPIGARAARLAELPDATKLTVALDSLASIEAIAAAARGADRPVSVYVELDVGMHRVGLPVVDEAIALARAVCDRAPLEFEGIAFYPGHVRDAEGAQSQTQKLAHLDADLSDAVQKFERAGVRPLVVSGGSTPTMWRTHELSVVTEMRPGTYVYNDRSTAIIGACDWSDCALTVLATVVSTAVPNQAVVDAGTKALGREPLRGADAAEGFGCVLGHEEVVVKSMSEEHGMLDLSQTSWRPSVGDRVRIIPNHVCIVVHLNDIIAGVRDDVVETTWPVAARGRGYALDVGERGSISARGPLTPAPSPS